MPLINVVLAEGKPPEYLKNVSEGLHEALRNAWGIPEHDCFQIFTEKKKEHFLIDRKMWGVHRSDDVIVFHITSAPRSKEMKLKLYEVLPKVLEERVGLSPADVFVSVINNQPEDWSFGLGDAQLLH